MSHNTTDSILYALFCLSRDTCHIDASELGRAAGVSASQAAVALVQLERMGLVDATRARLTMLGLARATALGAAGSGGPRLQLQHAKPKRTRNVALPIAARSELPPPTKRERKPDHAEQPALYA